MGGPLNCCSCTTFIHCDRRYSAAILRVSTQSLRFWLEKFSYFLIIFKHFEPFNRDYTISKRVILCDSLFDIYSVMGDARTHCSIRRALTFTYTNKQFLAITYSSTETAVPTAQESLTALFGMGTGVNSPLVSPRNLISVFNFMINPCSI